MTATAPHDERIPRDLVAAMREAAAWAAAMAQVVELRPVLVRHGDELAQDVDELLARSPARCSAVADQLVRIAAGAVLAVDEVLRACDAPPGMLRVHTVPDCPHGYRVAELWTRALAFATAAGDIAPKGAPPLEDAAIEHTLALDEVGRGEVRDRVTRLLLAWSRAFDELEASTRKCSRFGLGGEIAPAVATASRLRGNRALLEDVRAAAHGHLQGAGAGPLREGLRRLRAAGFGYGAPRTT